MYASTTTRRLLRPLVRAVLLLYLLTLGVAMASSVVHPKIMDLICTSTGYKLINQSGEQPAGEGKSQSHLLDCSLCLASGIAPLTPQAAAGAAPHALSYALRAIPAAKLAALVAAPLPARGPPALN